MKTLKLKIPNRDELKYRQHLISDKETMSYNFGWGDDGSGCYYQTLEQIEAWYNNWNNDSDNYYAYILRTEDNIPVGEANLHWDKTLKKHIAGITIEAKYRGRGYAKQALYMLAIKAFDEFDLDSIADDFSAERIAAEKTYLSIGFVRIKDDLVELTRERFRLISHYDALIDENNEYVHDDESLKL